MTQKLRETRFLRELAIAKLPLGGKTIAAVERIYVKKTKREEIRFSLWQGAKMEAKPLGLPEAELLPLLKAGLEAGVFSDEFTGGLREALGGTPPTAAAAPAKPADTAPATDLDRVQSHFHELIRARAGERLGAEGASLPILAAGRGTEDEPIVFRVPGMSGGFKYWWDVSSPAPRLMSESWSETVPGSGQLHEVTPTGARLLGEGFI
jgi:hypothetical protein